MNMGFMFSPPCQSLPTHGSTKLETFVYSIAYTPSPRALGIPCTKSSFQEDCEDKGYRILAACHSN